MAEAAIPSPATPRARLCVGVTGHRAAHAGYHANAAAIVAAVEAVLDVVQAAAAQAPVRLYSLLADGADQLATQAALARGWDVVAPLPFGRELNREINAPSPADAQQLDALSAKVQLFELADGDAHVMRLRAAAEAAPSDRVAAEAFAVARSERAALAGRVMIEQSDIVIGVWDGARTSAVGGTGNTILAALNAGAAVVWIDVASPGTWRVLRAPESLSAHAGLEAPGSREEQLAALVRDALTPIDAPKGRKVALAGMAALNASRWRARSNPLWHAYRRVEALFGGDNAAQRWRNLRQTYERPDSAGAQTGADMLSRLTALTQGDAGFVQRVRDGVLGRFLWADGVSSYLSDTYRGGMTLSFLLSALAIVGGVAYLPFSDSAHKWMFALFEFVLLSAILTITALGQRRRWHGRWFETRRVAEYLRHAPLLLALGAARAPGRWPRGAQTNWPEWYARHAVRETGLPAVRITPTYLRGVLSGLLDPHVTGQRDYHRAKALRLTRVHHRLDRASERLFQLAVVSVALYLLLKGAGVLGLISPAIAMELSKLFTFLGVLLPTFGGAIAGVRYFGDFERFAAISEVTAEKLENLHQRTQLLLATPDDRLRYGAVADLAHAADDVVVSEIENWQAVFSSKQVTVPV
jgi:hypothetical protein